MHDFKNQTLAGHCTALQRPKEGAGEPDGEPDGEPRDGLGHPPAEDGPDEDERGDEEAVDE